MCSREQKSLLSNNMFDRVKERFLITASADQKIKHARPMILNSGKMINLCLQQPRMKLVVSLCFMSVFQNLIQEQALKCGLTKNATRAMYATALSSACHFAARSAKRHPPKPLAKTCKETSVTCRVWKHFLNVFYAATQTISRHVTNGMIALKCMSSSKPSGDCTLIPLLPSLIGKRTLPSILEIRWAGPYLPH